MGVQHENTSLESMWKALWQPKLELKAKLQGQLKGNCKKDLYYCSLIVH